MFGRLGLLLTGLAVLVHGLALVARGLAADPNRVPWGNMYEFTLSGTFWIALLFLVALRPFSLRWMAPVVVAVVLSLLMLGVLVLYAPITPLTEALNSPWLVIHVVAAIIATATFTLGGISSVLYLSRPARVRARPATWPASRRRPTSTGSPTGCTPSRSRCGRSPC